MNRVNYISCHFSHKDLAILSIISQILWYDDKYKLSEREALIMPTISDIAKLAGVSQGTVSNVFNNKCNVSSDKIKKVMDAAMELGYVPNERAKLLRKGHTNLLSVLLPNIQSKQYIEFYLGFKSCAHCQDYDVMLQLTNENNPDSETAAVQRARSYMVTGIAAYTSFNEDTIYNPYIDDSGHLKSNESILFVDRKVSYSDHYIGFNYEPVGQALARRALEAGYDDILLLTGPLIYSNENDFYRGFMDTLSESTCKVHHVQTDVHRKFQNIMQFFDNTIPQAVFISNYDFAENVKDIYNTFFYSGELPIYTVSPLFTMPENDFIKYELNYRRLGYMAAQKLIDSLEDSVPLNSTILENSGFRNWSDHVSVHSDNRPLKVLTLDTPSVYSMKHLSKLYTMKTGTSADITTVSYDKMYEILSTLDENSGYDILRIDITWLNWFSEKILQPLDQIDPSVLDDLSSFVPSTLKPYSITNGHLYSLPFTPSIPILFYRKDLFNNSIYKQMYREKYKKDLTVPTNFDEFNKIARFFTKSYNPVSPVDYGATLTMGSLGVSSSEFLIRLFSRQEHLYDKNNKISLNSPVFQWALDNLIETKKYSTPKYCDWWNDTADLFAQGNVAMAILYTNFASNILKPDSRVVGNIGFASTPGHNPIVGGGYLGISKFSERPADALSFIRWACSEPVSSARTTLGSVSACIHTYDNYEIINHYPWLDLAQKDFVNCRGHRTPPSCHTPFNEYEFVGLLGNAIKDVYNGKKQSREALDEVQILFQEHFSNL